jgi:DNA-binding CsgD family transcriptional regulator
LKDKDRGPVRLAVDVADQALAERLVALLSEIPGIELVAASADADAVISLPRLSDRSEEPGIGLTPRELEVLALLAEGASNKAIARRLGISVHTAKFHVRSLLEKLDAVGRTDAVAHAASLGVLHL